MHHKQTELSSSFVRRKFSHTKKFQPISNDVFLEMFPDEGSVMCLPSLVELRWQMFHEKE